MRLTQYFREGDLFHTETMVAAINPEIAVKVEPPCFLLVKSVYRMGGEPQ